MAEPTRQRLLLIDDEPDIAAYIQRVAEGSGYEVRAVSSAQDFRRVLAEFNPDSVILDLAMPETDGIELLDVLARHPGRPKVLIVSGFDPTIVEVARSLGDAKGLRMVGAVTKPVRAADLRQLLSELAALP
jgi:CheY-like chemotaxis protein